MVKSSKAFWMKYHATCSARNNDLFVASSCPGFFKGSTRFFVSAMLVKEGDLRELPQLLQSSYHPKAKHHQELFAFFTNFKCCNIRCYKINRNPSIEFTG
jgi:hypothetical protein